jgi:hypothetical protein
MVVTIQGTPSQRFDEIPFATALVHESPGPEGPWTLIDSQALSPLDADPVAPTIRTVTTVAATLATGWYRLVFRDAAGHVDQPSDPVRASTGDEPLPPSPTSLRRDSPLLRQNYPVPAVDPAVDGDLRRYVYAAVEIVQALTWRIVDSTLGCPAPPEYACELVPPALVGVAVRAVQLLTERMSVTGQPGFAAQFASGRLLRGFSAGPYSESYFAPGEFARRGAQQGRPPMDVSEELDAALWALATEDARDYFVFRATGQVLPGGQAIAWDYRRENIGYGASGFGGWPTRGGW